MSLDDTVLVKWNGAANDSLESVELYYMTNEGSKAVALSGGTDYTFENSELKLLDGGKVTAGNVVALSDGYEKDTALLVEPLDGELTLLAKSDVETDQPLPLRVVKATLNQPLTLKLDDGSAPASIDTQKSFINEAHISGDPITITDDDYSYDSSTGELTFTNADHAESWMAFKVTNTAGEDAYGFIYLTAAQN